MDDRKRKPVEYERTLFEKGGVAVQLSMSKTMRPHYSIMVGRSGGGDRLVPYVAFEPPWDNVADLIALLGQVLNEKRETIEKAVAEGEKKVKEVQARREAQQKQDQARFQRRSNKVARRTPTWDPTALDRAKKNSEKAKARNAAVAADLLNTPPPEDTP